MAILRLILADQLSETISSLEDIQSDDVVMLCEVMGEATYVKHHKMKIAFLFSAMRHFADLLSNKNVTVRYVKLDDAKNTGNFEGEVARALASQKFSGLVVTEPGEYRLIKIFETWQQKFNLPVAIRNDNRFLATHSQFAAWAKNKKQLRMEYFYREMRKSYNILMDSNGKPTGGEWNYDKQNRKPPQQGLKFPERRRYTLSKHTRDVLALVEQNFAHHFGTLDSFNFAVTREQALQELAFFVQNLLPSFGDYQDAMVADQVYLYHSALSAYVNAGLLLPIEMCLQAEAAYHAGKAPLNAAEGFIRQILGWREYVRGIYWLHMPRYATMNMLGASQPLPKFYWSAETQMFCVAEAVRHTRDHAYSHHIQRLMITGNFALLAGILPSEVCDWYLSVYADAYEWVELPNTLGMALYGDGGIMASKPYAASGKYIHRMSNYCEKCIYDPDLMLGETACPFNALYWNFIARNEKLLRENARMPYVFSTWQKMAPQQKQAILEQANIIQQKLAAGTL